MKTDISLDMIQESSLQRTVSIKDLESLTERIREYGYDPDKPILVLRSASGFRFKLLDGMHRVRACRLLGYKTIPAIIKEPQ